MTAEDLSRKAADLFGVALRKFWSGDDPPQPPPTPVIMMHFTEKGTTEESIFPQDMGFLMETPRGKAIMFRALRAMRADVQPDIIAVAYDAYYGGETDLGKKLGDKKFRALANEHGLDWMFRQGYASKRECVVATAQTAEDVVMVIRPYAHTEKGDQWSWFPDEVNKLKQADLDGRTKIW